ncbi:MULTISPECIES: DUF3616 domain-containing protein [Rhizobium]|uniref:DUF3616 domain-containing protein n=1 Tax=Rhizobium TaxID=379 RepID=UPI001C8FE0ED|nr:MULTISPECIES: DUF3616 domain-containing protein [Rhizobium]MBY3271379.1 DUF3616 domain-containing protein [Rhizobium laguerreae]MBY3294468.1 DUF3616 domain-containing protein [Rhizobium laguerreae]MBY3327340.1 DUF3616 domain-containing protein [Rhizobium laguerreae]MBY3495644.1 DUF3616 domain-containing protein [Rhizobium laguerreae]MBY3543530.1 DUF3616 domain-containing protein [Rhizobium laguerreae]
MLKITVLSLGVIAPLLSTSSLAKMVESQSLEVQGKIIGKNDKKSEDVSGIACVSTMTLPRSCLVIDDNLQAAQSVTFDGDKLEAGDLIPLIDNRFGGKPLELDGEGVAFSADAFYVIGSHGHPRDKDHELDATADHDLISARIKAASQIVKLVVNSDGSLAVQGNPMSLSEAIEHQPDLAASSGKRLNENGLTIEGIAIRGDRLFAAFRGPTLPGGRAPVLSVSLKGLAAGSELDAKLFKLPLGEGMGIRDLASEGDHFLVLAGPSADVSGRYSIYSWDGIAEANIAPVLALTDIPGAGDSRKAETLISVSAGATGRTLLILFDGEKEGSPLLVRVSAD